MDCRADPFNGGFRVLIAGPQRFERTVVFAVDADSAVIAERRRETLEKESVLTAVCPLQGKAIFVITGSCTHRPEDHAPAAKANRAVAVLFDVMR